MQSQKPISLQEAQHRVFFRQLENFNAELSTSKAQKLLEILAELAETIKSLSEKNVNHADVSSAENELTESEICNIDLEIKLHKLRESIAEIKCPAMVLGTV